MRFELPPPMRETRLPQLLALLGEFTPVVEALPPDAALLGPYDGMRESKRDAVELAAEIRARSLSRCGIDCAVGIGPGPTLARFALCEATPGVPRRLPQRPDAVAELIASRVVDTLPGVTGATARALEVHGLDTLGRVAAAPLAVLCRLVGTEVGRDLREKASGVDCGRVVPNTHPARCLTAERVVSVPECHRAVLRSAARELGARLSALEKACRTLTLTLRYADHPAETRSRPLGRPTADSAALIRAARAMDETLAPQPARVSGLALHAKELEGADIGRNRVRAQWPSITVPGHGESFY
ncbi:DNA polymerase Y family protein [Streptomyces sp. ME02-8801-2C]|uniref:DNA polymerase Y family protein n=1 Tax=Streptomyces sp. ME02-8801-2C TaxID=3028680 RepID=UPI0039F71CB8